jgi:hypothetical protein
MNNLCKPKLGLIFVLFLVSMQIQAQNLETMFVEKMENVSLVVPEQCTPEDLIIVINSSIPNLKFESNMLPVEDFVVTYYESSNQYIICHEKIKFKLTVSGPNLQSEDIDIFDLNKQLAFRISANTAKGIVNIITNPRNATVIFPTLNNLVLSSNQPITNVSGKYRINIVKAQYKGVDTLIMIPRDAEKTYNIDLVPLFSRIKLDLKTDDNTPFVKTPIIWIDSVKIELDALVKSGVNQRSFFDNVEFLKFYEGNIIPLAEGTHKIKIELESYTPYETTIQTKNGKQSILSVSLEPIFGYLTFVDKQFAEGASIYINDQNIGKVPLFKVKTRVGNNKVRFEKPGYVPLEKEYTISIQEKQITDFDVSMQVARKINFVTEPSSAEIIMDGSRIGFSPISTLVSAGNHEILIKKSGFASEKISKIINETTPDEESVNLKLREVKPLFIQSEKDGVLVKLSGIGDLKNVAIDNTSKAPSNIPLPYGNYKISLIDGDKVVFKSTIEHSPEILERGKLPNYSRSSFHYLTGNYIDQNNFEASFGRIHIFPNSGLSTALINVEQRLITNDSNGGYRFEDMNNYDLLKDSVGDLKTLAPYLFFMNWEWRLGGSVLRQLDVNLLGRVKYTPGLKSLNSDVHVPGYSDVSMRSYFYGFEVSSRFSYANLSFRFGRQINNGKINYWDDNKGHYNASVDIPIKEDQYVASLGITLNGKVYKSNNMLRLWDKPLVDLAKRKAHTEKPKSDPDKKLFSKINIFGKTDKNK